MREDLQGEVRVPKAYAKQIANIGGRNPYGEPLWRVVHTTARMVSEAGEWSDWEESLTLEQRGGFSLNGDGTVNTENYKPIRIVHEIRRFPKYEYLENEGWIIERWLPSSSFWTRKVWEAYAMPDGTPYLGPYPEEGDYIMEEGPINVVPSLTVMRDLMAKRHRQLNDPNTTMQQRALEFVLREELRQKKIRKAIEARDKLMMAELVLPMGRVSLNAGRWREEMAARASIKEHVGN